MDSHAVKALKYRRSCAITMKKTACCYLQILLSDFLAQYGYKAHDAGYGPFGAIVFGWASAKASVLKQDAEDARQWLLIKHKIIDQDRFSSTWQLRV